MHAAVSLTEMGELYRMTPLPETDNGAVRSPSAVGRVLGTDIELTQAMDIVRAYSPNITREASPNTTRADSPNIARDDSSNIARAHLSNIARDNSPNSVRDDSPNSARDESPNIARDTPVSGTPNTSAHLSLPTTPAAVADIPGGAIMPLSTNQPPLVFSSRPTEEAVNSFKPVPCPKPRPRKVIIG